MPKKTPLHARIFGPMDRGDCIIEKVYLETRPGLFLAGNLFRPKGDGPFPAVLNAHGHWPEGRFVNKEDSSIAGRCINLARQGYVSFAYDMMGFGESKQISHQFGGQREKLWGISLGGLQTWNSIRALDFVQSLPYVDRSRIACTGASGGGTQTFLLTAVDDRVSVSAPVCMVSATMQGGCLCENLPGLRIDTNNVEIAAMAAPRPLVLVAATGDWTKDNPELEFPPIRHIYSLFGAQDRASCVRFDAGHNYNKASRETVYSWLGRWLPEKPTQGPVEETAFDVGPIDDLKVYQDEKLPDGALGEEELAAALIARTQAELQSRKPSDAAGLTRLRRLYLPALRHSLAITPPSGVTADTTTKSAGDAFSVAGLVIHEESRGSQIPALLFEPLNAKRGPAVLMVAEAGKAACLDRNQAGPGTAADLLLRRGYRVLMIDCFETGEHNAPAGSPERRVDEAFFDTYNRTDLSERVFDILTALAYLRGRRDVSETSVVGTGQAGLWCLLAKPFAPEVKSLVVDTDGFDASDDEKYLGELYTPCIKRAGDFRVASALCAPARLFLHNTQDNFDASWAISGYTASGERDSLRVEKAAAADTEITGWITTPGKA